MSDAANRSIEPEKVESSRYLQRISELTSVPVENFYSRAGAMSAVEDIAELFQLWAKITCDLERAALLQRMRGVVARLTAQPDA